MRVSYSRALCKNLSSFDSFSAYFFVSNLGGSQRKMHVIFHHHLVRFVKARVERDTTTTDDDAFFLAMSSGVKTRAQRRRIGERDSLWDLIVKCDDICFKHILPRFGESDNRNRGKKMLVRHNIKNTSAGY